MERLVPPLSTLMLALPPCPELGLAHPHTLPSRAAAAR